MARNLTRRQAIPKAIELLECLPQNEEVVSVIQALEKYYSTPLARWDAPSVYEALEEWSSKHDGRAPTAKECDNDKNLPSHGVFEKLFGKTAREFLNELYGEQEYVRIGKHKKLCINNQYDFLQIFKAEFERIRPRTSKMYDANRDPETPSWQTIARRCQISNWSELVSLAGVEASCLQRQYNSYYVKNNLMVKHKEPEQRKADLETEKRKETEFNKLIMKTNQIISDVQGNQNSIETVKRTRTIQIRRK